LTIADGITEPVGPSLHHLDLVGDALGEGVRHSVVEVVEDLVSPPLERAPGVDELRDAGGGDVIDLQLQSSFGFGTVRGVVDDCELLLEHPRRPDFRQ